MAKRLPLHPGLGRPFIGQRPHTAPGATTWIQTDRGRRLTLEQVEPLIHTRLANIKSAFMAVDPDGAGLVSREEFRRVLKSLLSVGEDLLDAVFDEVRERSGETTVDYMRFLRRFSGAPAAHRACSSRGSVRRGPQSTSMSLSEIQKHLKEKIGGNLRTVIRVFGLFDCSREGHIQQLEFRRILDNYCIHLTDKEFQRLWNHYCPNNSSTISYQLFLDKLGFDDFRIAPVCTKLEVSSRGTTPPEKQRKQRPESLDSPSVLRHRKLQTLFYDKMCMNSTSVWQALQAFDTARSGLVKQDVLRAVLSSFIFPMNPHSFQKLTSCYGVKATGPVRWKHFLGHFMRPVKGEGDAVLHTDGASEQPAPEEDVLDLQDLYPGLKHISRLHTTQAGWITRSDLRHLLERPGGTRPRSQRSQITEMLNAMDPEHTGVIQLASLESILSAPTGNTPSPSPPPPPSPASPAEPLDVPEEAEHAAEEQKTADERQTTQCADKLSLASASRRRVDNLLLDEQLSSVLAALELRDPQRTGYVTREDLKKALSCYGVPVSDSLFNKLCETSSSRPGSSSKTIHYSGFLRNLEAPLTDETCTSSSHTERPFTAPPSTLQSVRGRRPPSGPQVTSDACSILDIVFRRMRSRLEQRRRSLADRIRVVTHSSDGTLSQADVRKILEDSWVILDDENFHKLTELLGFRDGRIERSAFLVKYEAAAARDGQRRSGGHGDEDEVDPSLTSAEQCLAVMKTRIKIKHGDNLTAFRLMDRKRKGVVDRHDFSGLYSSLGFSCGEAEYERLLHLIGLHPGGNLNYAEFVNIVENNGKQGKQTACVQDQLHELLACEARYKWADMSKVLCQSDTDGQDWIHKKSLRELLFTFALPLISDEFDQLWSRYDPEGRGRVAVCDFLEKLGFHHEGEPRARSQKLNQEAKPESSGAASPEGIEQVLQETREESRDPLETRSDGSVTVEELLKLLQTYSCSVQREQLVNHLSRLDVAMDDTCSRLAYMDFLSAENRCEPPPATPDAVRQIESLDGLSPGVALTRLRQLVAASAPHLHKAFSAFDRSGTATVTALEFRQVLESFCARLSDKQYRYMLTKLQLDRENCTVNWKDFLNRLQSQSPLISERCLSETRSPIQTKTSGVTEHLQQIQEVVVTKEHPDQDPSISTAIPKEQLSRRCDHRRPRLTDDQCVCSQTPVNEQKKLQLREFRRRFMAAGGAEAGRHSASEPRASAGGALQRTKSAPQCSSRRPASAGRPGTGSPPGSTERSLRGAVRRRWKEIQRNCTEEDPQREGLVSATSFLEILRSLGIHVTREQFEHLAVRCDAIRNGCVSYHDFLRHFLLNLKPAEAETPYGRRKLPLPVAPTSHGVLSKDCVEVMLRMHDVVHSSWTSIRRCFLTCDRARAGSVSVQDFRKVLRHFGVKLTEEEFFHLSSYFDANTAGKICYDNFLWAFLH